MSGQKFKHRYDRTLFYADYFRFNVEFVERCFKFDRIGFSFFIDNPVLVVFECRQKTCRDAVRRFGSYAAALGFGFRNIRIFIIRQIVFKIFFIVVCRRRVGRFRFGSILRNCGIRIFRILGDFTHFAGFFFFHFPNCVRFHFFKNIRRSVKIKRIFLRFIFKLVLCFRIYIYVKKIRIQRIRIGFYFSFVFFYSVRTFFD